MGKLGIFLFVICLVVAFYFWNSAFSNAINIPAGIMGTIDTPFKIIGGVLLIFGGFLMIKLGKKKGDIPA